MTTIFTRIINGEIPGTFVWKDEHCVAFLSINPIAPGHTLVVPRLEVDHWIDLPDDIAQHLYTVSHVIGRAQQQAFVCERIGLMVAGFEVPHTHVHVIPTRSMADLSFANAARTVERDAMDQAAGAIRRELRVLGRSETSD